MPTEPFRRALVLKGGALGDFLLILPVLAALREAAPQAQIEILAYPKIASLAAAGGLIDAAHPIEYGPLAGFFTRGAVLNPSMKDFFASFDLVISYLYDPDKILAENLRTSGVTNLICGPHRPEETAHAIDQLAAPLSAIGLPLGRRAVHLSIPPKLPSRPTVAIHPGSGSTHKNWAPDHWRQLVKRILEENPTIEVAVIGGECDAAALAVLGQLRWEERLVFHENLPLPDLAAHLGGCSLYLGHDTGISHLAAASGVPSLLLFGPTEPGVWAPPHDQVHLLRAPDKTMENLTVDTVMASVRRLLPQL